MKQLLKQRGNDRRFPDNAEFWDITDKELPEWLTDRAKIAVQEDTGEIYLLTRPTNQGGYEILDSSGLNVLAKIKNPEQKGGLLFSKNHPITYLTEKQIKLIYYPPTQK